MLGAVLVCAAGLTACTGPDVALGPFGGLPEGVSVSVVQLRGDIAPGRVQLHLENGSDAAVTVSSASLSSPVFAEDAAWAAPGAETLAPGRAVNLPVPLPPIRCAEVSADPRATLTLDSGSGAFEVSAAAGDALGVLAALGATECDREAVEAIATVEAIAVEPRADGTAELELAITPTTTADAGSLRLVALRGTTLLRFADGEEAALGLEVAASDAASVARVRVVPRRCDPHAIAEDKVGTTFTLVAELSGREVTLPLPRPQSVADALLTFTAAACGLTP